MLSGHPRHEKIVIPSIQQYQRRTLFVPCVASERENQENQASGSKRIVDTIVRAVAAQELLVGQTAPIRLVLVLRHQNDHSNSLFGGDLGGKVLGYPQVSVCAQFGFEF